jgi:hypothetical protein
MGLKQGAIGNTHGEHIENMLEQRKNEKNLPSPPPPPPQNLKEKSKTFKCTPSLPIGYMKLLLPKLFGTIFNLD